MNRQLVEDKKKLNLFKKLGYDIPKAQKYIFAKVKILPGRILEVGTGKGNMTQALAKKGFYIVSIDVDKKALGIARTKIRESGYEKKVTLRLMNAEKLKFRNQSFESIVSVNFMHHAHNPLRCLKEMARVCSHTIVIADLNKRGSVIMQKVHAQDGHKHEETKISFEQIGVFLRKKQWKVLLYKDTCQNVVVAKKGEEK